MSNDRLEEILKLSRGFMESRILLSAAELNLFTILSPVPLSAREVASRIGADQRALTSILDALSAMGLLVKKNETYQSEKSLSSYLSEDAPGSILPMLLHAAHLWQRWSQLTTLIRTADVPKDAEKSFRSPEQLRAFIGAMNAIAAPQANEIVAAVNPGSSRALLDVGGASGTYTIAFLQAVPEMKATLFDIPEVVEMARERLSKADMLDRVTLIPGDFYKDEFPPGHDLAFLSAIIHQNSPEQNLDLFNKVYRALRRGGRILIRDHVMEPDRTRPREGAIFAINMLIGTAGGRTYTYEEIKDGLSQAGFSNIRPLRKGEHMDALVEAFK